MHITQMSHYRPGKTNKSTIQHFWGVGGSGNKVEMIWLIVTFAIVVFVIQVIQFGADCDHDECTCRDPDAEENKSKTKQMQDAGGGVQW